MKSLELKDVLNGLEVFGNDQPVPKEALAEAVRLKETVIPILLDAVDTVYEKVRAGDEDVYDDPVFDLASYGFFLLAQVREQKAFSRLLKILELDEDSLDAMLGDILDCMGKILYSTYDGDLSALRSVIENDSLYPFARGAALEVLDGILGDGRLSREELIELLRKCLAALGEGEDEETFGALLASLIADNDLYELTEDVREAYRLEKIDLRHMGGFDSFFDYLYNETDDRRHTKPLNDTAQELSGWACFKSSGPSRMDILNWDVGRNDPCPCGSGKKFKKCCLPKQEEMKIAFSNLDLMASQDKYPPVERQGSRPGLSELYDRDAIEVDHLAYQALQMLRRPSAGRRREERRAYAEAKKLLWEAFEKFQRICEAKGLDTPEAYDQDHKLHYFSREWLDELSDMLEGPKDERYQMVQAVLCTEKGETSEV